MTQDNKKIENIEERHYGEYIDLIANQYKELEDMGHIVNGAVSESVNWEEIKTEGKKYITQAKAQGAAKLAEKLLGSEEMKELVEIPYEKHEYCLPHEHCFDCERNTEIRSRNKTVSAIKAKIKELCPTTTPSST